MLDALGALEPSNEKHEVEAVRRLVPDALITFGAGTNQLASQKVLADRMPTMERNPVFSAVWAILGVAGLSLWLYWNERVADILWGGVLVLLFFITQQLVLLWRRVGSSPLEARWWKKEPGNNREDKDDPWKDKYYRYIFIALMMIWVFLTNFLYKDLPWGSLGWLCFAATFLLGSIRFILSSEGKKIVQAPVSRPLGLHRWIDLYASADPVPNGPTRTIEGKHDSKLIWNLGSLFADHTAYWNNRDGFVLRVARVCAETAKSPWTHGLPDEFGLHRQTCGLAGRLPAGGTLEQRLNLVSAGRFALAPASSERTRTVQSAQLGSCSAGSARSVRGAHRVGDVGNVQCVVLDMELVGLGGAGGGAGSRTAGAGIR